MSSVTVTLPPETERKLRDKALSAGLTLEGYIRHLAEQDADANGVPLRERSLDELAAPVRQAFRASGMTDTALADLVEETREEVWQEKQARKAT